MKVEYFPMGKIYYSKMNQTPEAVFISEVAVLTKEFGVSDVTFHGGGQYHEDKLLSAKVVIVTGFNGDLVGRGVFAEINNAILNDIPVYQFNKVNNNMFNGIVIFRKIIECVLFDATDYYLKYGKCKYAHDHNGEIQVTINYIHANFSGSKSPAKKAPDKYHSYGRNKNAWDDEEEEVISESDDKDEQEAYFAKSKPQPEAKKMPSENKPGPDDFDGDTNMMY